jgi:hypothetical protein
VIQFLNTAGWAFLVLVVATWVVLPRRRQLGRLLCAATNDCFALAELSEHRFFGAVNAVVCGYSLWLWWINGDGDNTRRRLRRLRERFTPVRRTAPAAAMAVTR